MRLESRVNESRFSNFTRAVALTVALGLGSYGCSGLQINSADVNKNLKVQTYPLRYQQDGSKKTLFYDIEYINKGDVKLRFLKTEKCYTFNGRFDRCEIFGGKQMAEQIGSDSIQPSKKLRTRYPSHFWTDAESALLEATVYAADPQGKDIRATYSLELRN